MAQSDIEIDKIIDAMNSDTLVDDIFAKRIYWNKPISDTQSGIYALLNIVTAPIIEEAYKAVRVEVRIVANDASVTNKTLMNAKKVITKHFQNTHDHNGFYTFNIVEGGNFYNGTDEKSRNILVQDYIFYFDITQDGN